MAVSVWQGCAGCTLIPLNLSGQLKSSSHVNRAPGGTLLLHEQQVEGTVGVHVHVHTHTQANTYSTLYNSSTTAAHDLTTCES